MDLHSPTAPSVPLTGSPHPLRDPATGLPALVDLSPDAGIALVAGLLARVADQESPADLLVGAHPETDRPVWVRLAEAGDGDEILVAAFDGHPATPAAHALGSATVGDAEAAWYGGTVLARIHQAAEDVYDRALALRQAP